MSRALSTDRNDVGLVVPEMLQPAPRIRRAPLNLISLAGANDAAGPADEGCTLIKYEADILGRGLERDFPFPAV